MATYRESAQLEEAKGVHKAAGGAVKVVRQESEISLRTGEGGRTFYSPKK